MVDYRPDTCAYCNADTWCEQRKNGKPQCRACKVERFFENVLYPPLGLRLLDWQRRELRAVYGKVRPEDGVRTIRRVFESMAKKNGKSFLVGGLPIYHMTCETHIDRQEAYGAAAAKDQAGIVFRAAAALVNANTALKNRLRILDSTKRILRRDGGGFYMVVSADGDVQDGMEPSLAIMDEVHRWTTESAQTLFSVITKGMASRLEATAWEITTAGDPYKSQLWAGEYSYAKKILNGSLQSDRFHAAIWEADRTRLVKEKDYWTSREARIAANPSHEDLGGFLKDENIAEDLEKSKVDATEKRKYFRLNLNVAPDMLEDGAIDPVKWQACDGGVDMRTWPTYDVELLISKWGLAEKPCYAGVDASWTTDLTALTLVFPPDGPVAPWTLLTFGWLPEARIQQHEKSDKVEYRNWLEKGFLEATPGNAVDYDAIKGKLRWAREMFDLREMAYDPWNFRQTATDLMNEGFNCQEVSQNYGQLSEPTKRLLSLYVDGDIRHGNNPFLNWCASCMELQADKKDNVQPAKPDRRKNSARIDPMAAAVTALARALRAEPVGVGFWTV